MGLFSFLGRIMGIGREPQRSRSRVPSGTAKKRASLADFEDRLRAAIRITGRVSAGQVRFLGLSQVRDHFGPRWAHLSETVEATVRSIIDRRLANFETCTEVGQLQYVMVFPTLDEAAARIRCAAIADEITKRLFGDALFGQEVKAEIAIESTVATLDRRCADPKADLIGTLLQRLEQDAAKQSERRLAVLSTGPGSDGRPRDGDGGTGEGRNPAAKRPGARQYRPMWDVSRGVVSSFLYAGEVAGRLGDAADLAECDRWALGEVASDLARIVEAGRKLLLTLPVHYTTLSVGTEQRLYLPLCRKLSPAMVGLLVFEVLDVPVGVPPGRLVELVALLKPFGRVVLIRLPLHSRLFKAAGDARVFAVGTDLGSQAASESDTIDALQSFIQSAKASRMHSYAIGVSSLSLASAAIGGGIDYLNGEIVADPLTELPESIYRFGIRNLYRGERS